MRELLSSIRVERDSDHATCGRPKKEPISASRGRVGASTSYYTGRRKEDSGDLEKAWATHGRNDWESKWSRRYLADITIYIHVFCVPLFSI